MSTVPTRPTRPGAVRPGTTSAPIADGPPGSARQHPEARLGPALVKVPAITVLFWVIKTLTTGMGEALSDYLAGTNLVVAVLVGVVGLATALWFQLRSRRYVPALYWSTVAMVAVFGTMAADAVHLVGLPYLLTTALYLLAVGALFLCWYRSEGTLSVHSITTRRRELFYWTTVLASFALGTAAGDLTANELRLGYLTSVAVFAVAIAVPAVGWRFLRLNPVAAFWIAYVLTRPLGASIADWLGKPPSHGGGIGLGDGPVAAVAIIAIALLVGLVSARHRDRRGAEVTPA